MKDLERDSIDFGKMSISQLFIKLFVPTLLGLIFTSAFNIIDGIIVGQGVGSNALAAVNVAAPIFLISTAFGLMFASGVSIVAAVHLSRENVKAANINITQAYFIPLLFLVPLSVAINVFAVPLSYLFGGSDLLCPLIVEYMRWICPCPVLTHIIMVGIFVIRLDGSPKYAMALSIVAATINTILDIVMVYPLQWGLMGAAFATTISMGVEAFMVVIYMMFKTKNIKLYNIKFSRTSLYLTCRNIGYMMKLGFSTFIGEGAILFMLIVGNHSFMSMLHEDGVAAFSVCCYLFPLVFMFGNSIAQSQLPIISYNYGQKNTERVYATFRLSMIWATSCGLLLSVLGYFCNAPVVELFLNPDSNAYHLATEGLSLFSISFIFFTLNLVLIGYYQSIERANSATFFMLLRGAILLIPIFIILPAQFGAEGLWLSVPLSEALTFCCIAVALIIRRREEYT